MGRMLRVVLSSAAAILNILSILVGPRCAHEIVCPLPPETLSKARANCLGLISRAGCTPAYLVRTVLGVDRSSELHRAAC